MLKARFRLLIDEQFNKIKALTATKGEEYTQSEDQLANFKRHAVDFGMSQEQVLGIYLNKHVDSIKGYIKYTNAPTQLILSEPIEGRIDDAILYLLLLRAMVVEKAEARMKP